MFLGITFQHAYAVTLGAHEHGNLSVTLVDGSPVADLSKVAHGTKLKVSTTPDAGYKLGKLVVVVGEARKEITDKSEALVEVVGAVTLSAEFEQMTYAVTLGVHEHCKLAVTLADGSPVADLSKVAHSTKLKVSATPDAGYLFEKMTLTMGTEVKDYTQPEAVVEVVGGVEISALFKLDTSVDTLRGDEGQLVALYSVEGNLLGAWQEGINIAYYSSGVVRKLLLTAEAATALNAKK